MINTPVLAGVDFILDILPMARSAYHPPLGREGKERIHLFVILSSPTARSAYHLMPFALLLVPLYIGERPLPKSRQFFGTVRSTTPL
jgi:hypothetical protein